MQLKRLSTGVVALLCSLNYSHAQSLEMTGSISIEFTEVEPYVWNINGINANLNLGVPVSVPISIKSWLSPQPAFYWNDVSNWDNPLLALANVVEIAPIPFQVLTANPSFIFQLPDAVDVLVNGGPTERSISVAGLVVSDDIPGLSESLSASAVLKFDVTIPSGRGVIMNQAATIQNLHVEDGASLSGNSEMHIRENLDVDGSMYDLAGEVNGDIIVSGETVQSGRIRGFQNIRLVDGIHTIGGTSLELDAQNQVQGSGTIRFAGSSPRLIFTNGNPTIPSGVTIDGYEGRITWPTESIMQCNGDIRSDFPGDIAVIGLWVRAGNLSAENGGSLHLGGTWHNACASPVSCDSLSTVVFTNNCLVHLDQPLLLDGDGSFLTRWGARFAGGRIGGNATLEMLDTRLYFDGVELDLPLEMLPGGDIYCTNGLVVNGSINFHDGGGSSLLLLQGGGAIAGTGDIIFGDQNAASDSIMRSDPVGRAIDLGPDLHVRGADGTIADAINRGRITADHSNGTIRIDGVWRNEGILEARNGGKLILAETGAWASPSALNCDSLSTVVFTNNCLVHLDQPLLLDGDGSFLTRWGARFAGGRIGGNATLEMLDTRLYFDGVELDLPLEMLPGGDIYCTNGLVVNGSINFHDGGSASLLLLQGGGAIAGTGDIIFGDQNAASDTIIRSEPSGLPIELGSGLYVHGTDGTIEDATNKGRISADCSNGTIRIDGVWRNEGILEARNGGKLILAETGAWASPSALNCDSLSTVVFTNNCLVHLDQPLLLDGDGSFLTRWGARFAGGRIGGNATLEMLDTRLYFDGVELDLPLEMLPGGDIYCTNGLVVNGSINFHDGGSASLLLLQGGGAIAGTGDIIFGDQNAASDTIIRSEPSGLPIELGSGLYVHGTDGTIEDATNKGRISANCSNGLIRIDGAWRNEGSLEVLNGGTLSLEGAWTNHGTVICMPVSSRIYADTYYCGETATSRFHISSASLSSDAPLLIGGSAKLDGTLEVLCIDGFQPSLGDSFELLSASGSIGNTRFAVTNLPALPIGRGWSVEYGATSVHIQVVEMAVPDLGIANINLLSANGGLQLSLAQSIEGVTYAIYSSPTLIPTQQWQAVVGSIQTGTGSGVELTITNGLLPLNYYRIGYYEQP